MSSIQRLPALEDNRYLRFTAFAILYAAQGLPWGLFIIGLPAWLAGRGVSAGDIGWFVGVAALPWSFKLVAGPLMDRYTFLAMGRRRPWVISAQAGILLGCLLLAFAPAPDENLMLIAMIGFFINAFCALQDVAVDGMAIDVLPVNERARANAFMFGGQVVGISGASAAGTWLLSNFGLSAAAIVIAFAVIVIMLVPIFFRERDGEKLMPWSEGEPSTRALDLKVDDITVVFKDLFRALILPMSILLVLCEFLNRASSGVFVAITPVVTVQELGFADTDYANWQATGGVLAAIFGVIVAPLVDKKGASTALMLAIAFKAILFMAIGLLASWWSHPYFFSTAIIVASMASQIVTVSIIALFMTICAKQIAATQFAVYMASANLALSAGSTLVALIDPILTSIQIYYVAAIMNVLFLLLWPLFNLERHQKRLEALEST